MDISILDNISIYLIDFNHEYFETILPNISHWFPFPFSLNFQGTSNWPQLHAMNFFWKFSTYFGFCHFLPVECTVCFGAGVCWTYSALVHGTDTTWRQWWWWWWWCIPMPLGSSVFVAERTGHVQQAHPNDQHHAKNPLRIHVLQQTCTNLIWIDVSLLVTKHFYKQKFTQ